MEPKIENRTKSKSSYLFGRIRYALKAILGDKQISPIFSAILGGLILYFAQQYFDRDRVEIVDASIRVKKLEIQLNPKTLDSIKNLTTSTILDRSATILNSDQIISVLRGFALTIYSYQNEINIVRQFDSEAHNISKDSSKKKDTSVRSEYSHEIDLYNEKIRGINSLKNSLIIALRKQYQLNKNNFFIEVIVQNKGNKQGIIRYKAVLQIDDANINLSKSNNQSDNKSQAQSSGQLLDNFLTVEAHSFNGLSFDIDNYFNKPGDIEIAKKEFEVGQKNARILLFSVDTKLIGQFSFLCRDDFSRNANGPLLQYLKDINLPIDQN